MKPNKFARFFACGLSMLAATAVHATVVIGFANGDSFDGDGVGGTAGPFTDTVTGLVGTITTTALNPAGSVVNTTAGQLGINAPGGGDAADAFDSAESWTFSWNEYSRFVGIDFGLYSTASENNAFTIQSAAWVGASITPGSANVTFNSSLGRFTFANGTLSDIFTSSDLYGTSFIPIITPGTTLTLAFNPSGSDTAVLEGMSFDLVHVPEPSTVLLIVAGGALVWRRARSRK